MKILKFGTKNALFGCFGTAIWKNHCHILNQRPRICLIANSSAKIKILKFGTKNAWFAYFWVGNWRWYCHISNQQPRICPVAKFHEKMKMPKFGTKNALLGYFWARIFKKLLSYLKPEPSNSSSCKISRRNKNA